jgi:hypothetical protein
MALFGFNVTTCKTTQKWQKEGRFTTPVPVDPQKVKKGLKLCAKVFIIISAPCHIKIWNCSALIMSSKRPGCTILIQLTKLLQKNSKKFCNCSLGQQQILGFSYPAEMRL